MTGLSLQEFESTVKWLELVKQVAPRTSHVGWEDTMRRTALMAGLALAGGIGIGGGMTEFLHAQPQLMRHTPLVTQNLTGLVGKEGVLVKVEYAPARSVPIQK